MTHDWNIIDDQAAPAPVPHADVDHLNHDRIRLIVAERRAVYRRQQWALGITLACTAGAIAMAGRAMALLHARSHLPWAFALLAGSLFLCFRAVLAYRRWRDARETAASTLVDAPTPAPRFDELSDGQQRLQNLESLDPGRRHSP